MSMITLAAAVFLYSAKLSGLALAYIDPSTGGMLFQILAMAFAVFSGLVFFFFRQIKSAFARFRRFLSDKFGG
jgi:hypothetical protein